jgi:hypothetical protein
MNAFVLLRVMELRGCCAAAVQEKSAIAASLNVPRIITHHFADAYLLTISFSATALRKQAGEHTAPFQLNIHPDHNAVPITVKNGKRVNYENNSS